MQPNPTSFVVGLTGGIGSGKTVVSDHFAEIGVPVIDTDVIAREVVEPGQPALAQLVDAFGAQILQADGSLDREALREIAFSDPENKRTLDSITHPAIRVTTFKQIVDCTYPYCVVVIPLLVADSPFFEFMQRVLVVTAEQETKIERVKQRSQLSREEVLQIMRNQISDEERLQFADDVIANDGTIEDAHAEVERLHQVYLELSTQGSKTR